MNSSRLSLTGGGQRQEYQQYPGQEYQQYPGQEYQQYPGQEYQQYPGQEDQQHPGQEDQQHLEQEQEQEDKNGAVDFQPSVIFEAQHESYDPDQYQNYCYNPQDGNYYYYPTQESVAKADAVVPGDFPAVAEDRNQAYTLDDWEPKSHGSFKDIVLGMFISKEFRIYLTFLLFCAGVLMIFLSMAWTFQILFRVYVPPKKDHNADWQAMSYVVIFFYLSFTSVTVFCTWLDMLRGMWNVKRDDTAFWGMKDPYFFSRKSPPCAVYFCLIVMTAVFPILYAFIDTISKTESVLYFGQVYAYVSIITAECIIALCYVWFYFRALKEKVLAFKERKTRDDFYLWDKTLKHKEKAKKHWYHASTILEEYGLDGKTLRWNAVVFTVGCVPLFGLLAGYKLITSIDDSPVTWGAISCIALSSIYVVAWMTLLRTRSHWSLYTSWFLTSLLLVIGLIGAGVSSSKEAAVVIIILFVICHGMLTRKRRHELTRLEICSLLNIDLDSETHQESQRRRVDTYLCCCTESCFACFKCFRVKAFFGYRHPSVVHAERRYAIDRVSLMTDQKVLMVWWLFVMLTVACVIGLGNTMVYTFTGSIATKVDDLSNGTHPNTPMCQMRFNTGGSAPLGLYDLSLLSALSYTIADNGDVDFATWFSHLPGFVRRFPIHLPPTLDYATDGINITFSDYVDLVSDFHFITLNSNNRGMSFMRSVEEWSSSLAIQMAGAISPLVSIWPKTHRRNFVDTISFFQKIFPYSIPLDRVSSYIQELISGGKTQRILLIGDGFNGGYAKMLSAKYGVPFVVFNPPGTKYKLSPRIEGVQFSFTGGILSYVDSLEDTAGTFHLGCDKGISSTKCSKIEMTIKALRKICGDRNGRVFR